MIASHYLQLSLCVCVCKREGRGNWEKNTNCTYMPTIWGTFPLQCIHNAQILYRNRQKYGDTEDAVMSAEMKWEWMEWNGEWAAWVMSLIMIWASYRAAAGMMDSSAVCTAEGHSSLTHSNLCVCVCAPVLQYHTCIFKFFILPLCLCECNLVVKAVYCG